MAKKDNSLAKILGTPVELLEKKLKEGMAEVEKNIKDQAEEEENKEKRKEARKLRKKYNNILSRRIKDDGFIGRPCLNPVSNPGPTWAEFRALVLKVMELEKQINTPHGYSAPVYVEPPRF